MRNRTLRGHQKKKGKNLNNYVERPSEKWSTGTNNSFYGCFPELKQYQDKVHLVYASAHVDHAINRRETMDVVNEIRQARENGKTKIVFFNNPETFLSGIIHRAQFIAEILKEIPKKDLFYSVGVPDGQEFYDNLCEEYGWPNRFNVLSCHHFEHTIFAHAIHLARLDVPYQVRVKPKLFVCFNKLHRKHRVQLLAESIRNNWLDKSFYSFEGAWSTWHTPDEKFRLIEAGISEEDYLTIQTLKDKFPLRLNLTTERPNPVDLKEEDLYYHQHSYFSIVTETIFYKNKDSDSLLSYMNTLFLSEKIYKPFAFKHPFITFAWPGTLKALRDRGYKTFHPYIDESYDSEQDAQKRFKMLIKEIKRLEQFTPAEWIEWQTNIKPIVEYNYKYLLSLTDHRVGPPVDHLFVD